MTQNAPDPRVNAYRGDLASAELQGRVTAERFTEGVPAQLVPPSAPLRKAGRFDAPLETEVLLGETVRVFDEFEGWAWVQCDIDDYVGYLPSDALTSTLSPATHRVSALRTYLYPEADIKAPPLDLISMNSRVCIESIDDRFAKLKDGRFIIASHLSDVDEFEDDFVAVAEHFLGTPYLWGGRTSLGLDCSALIQLSLQATGKTCPRDTDLQEATLGESLSEPPDQASYRRGDLLFWKGHVGLMLDESRLLHANAHHMATAIEPASEAISRIAASESELLSVKRLD